MRVELFAFGRSVAEGAWYVDHSRIVNRLYFVNGGSARLGGAHGEWTLSEGNFYILPRSEGFSPIASPRFDHTYFDYYSPRMLRPDRIVERRLDAFGASHFLAFVNTALAEGKSENPHEAMQALLQGFLGCVMSDMPRDLFIENEAVLCAVERIHSDFATVTTKDLAAEAHLCESYFIRLFRECIGCSPLRYIRARRVLYGKQLLAQGVSVERAAEICGYLSASAFYKAVKSEIGQAPSVLKNSRS